MHTTTEELLETVFSVWSVLKLYKEDQWDQDSRGKFILTRTMKSPYYTVTDLIKALPGNDSVNTSQHATI
jgi:hypothetical protein